MRYEFKLPDLAEGMVEGELVSWLVEPGDEVQPEQPVAEVMTDKATVSIPCPKAGTVQELCYDPGDVAEVGSTLFVLEIADEAGAQASEPAASGGSGGEASRGDGSEASERSASGGKGGKGEGDAREAGSTGERRKRRAGTSPERPSVKSSEGGAEAARREERPASKRAEPAGDAGAAAARVPRGPGKALATPATRRLARELGVDIDEVPGSGSGGRVLKEDVRAFAEGRGSGAESTATSPAASAAPAPPEFRRPAPEAEEAEERVKIRGLRRNIQETMARSKRTAAHFTYVEEIDCEQLVDARERLKATTEAQGVKLTYLPFIAKATLLSLRLHPKMNARLDDEAGEVVYQHHQHLGIAAATDAGLTVPVLRHADRMSLLELAVRTRELAQKARDGKLSPEEAKGSTFTITSLGKLGGILATPIINHPEVAILGIHKMEQRAVVRQGVVVPRRMMNLSLSFDHRLIDGHEGAEFTQQIKRYLEDPEMMMLEMV